MACVNAKCTSRMSVAKKPLCHGVQIRKSWRLSCLLPPQAWPRWCKARLDIRAEAGLRSQPEPAPHALEHSQRMMAKIHRRVAGPAVWKPCGYIIAQWLLNAQREDRRLLHGRDSTHECMMHANNNCHQRNLATPCRHNVLTRSTFPGCGLPDMSWAPCKSLHSSRQAMS